MKLSDTNIIDTTSRDEFECTYSLVLNVVQYDSPFKDRFFRRNPNIETMIRDGIDKNVMFRIVCSLVKPKECEFLKTRYFYSMELKPFGMSVVGKKNLITGETPVRLFCEWSVDKYTYTPYHTKYLDISIEESCGGFKFVTKVTDRRHLIFDRLQEVVQKQKFKVKGVKLNGDPTKRSVVLSPLDDIPFTE